MKFPELHPEDIEVIHIEKYVAAPNDRDLSQNSIKKYLEVLSSFYSYAMKWPHFEGITGNPAAVVMEEISRVRRDRPDCAAWESACKIINHTTDPRNKTVQIVLAKTGARLREALSIRNEDLMLDDGFIRLRNRKGGKQTVVPIDGETVQAIEMWYYDTPRDCSLTDVAAALDIAKSTASETLHRAEELIIKEYAEDLDSPFEGTA